MTGEVPRGTSYVKVAARDPLIARDGRPFGEGLRMRSLDWLYPSVFAGSLRTLLGKRVGVDFTDDATLESLKRVDVAGPLALLGNELYFPRPMDLVVRRDGQHLERFAMRPCRLREHEGCDLPWGMLPVMLPERAETEFKPAVVPALWSHERMRQWLLDLRGEERTGDRRTPQGKKAGAPVTKTPLQDRRTHVRIDPERGAAGDGLLFTTTGLDFARDRGRDALQLAARVVTENEEFKSSLKGLEVRHPLGGERRLAHWANGSAGDWSCPPEIRDALAASPAPLVRMILATPALFRGGWNPGWLCEGQHSLEGTRGSVRLRLRGAAVDRWQPISGWSLEKSGARSEPGPKPARRLVPAGSVYFFEVLSASAAPLADEWLQSVCDEKQDGLDGFGLGLWGTWEHH